MASISESGHAKNVANFEYLMSVQLLGNSAKKNG